MEELDAGAVREMFDRWKNGYAFNDDSDEDVDLSERVDSELAAVLAAPKTEPTIGVAEPPWPKDPETGLNDLSALTLLRMAQTLTIGQRVTVDGIECVVVPVRPTDAQKAAVRETGGSASAVAWWLAGHSTAVEALKPEGE